jgi:uncharacterized membrane protein (DUF4010 family)
MGLLGALAAMAADELASPMIFLGIVLLLGIFAAIAYFIDASRGQVGLSVAFLV